MRKSKGHDRFNPSLQGFSIETSNLPEEFLRRRSFPVSFIKEESLSAQMIDYVEYPI